jgi:hypothetical protein
MATIDPSIIQRFLFIISDLIRYDRTVDTSITGIPKVIQSYTNRPIGINTQDSFKLLRTEHELLSLSFATSPDVASELFSNNESDISRNFGYIISHNIIINLPVDGKQQLYYFNIDKLNRTHAKGDNRDFFIKKINITNKSKDIFTTNCNYQVTFDINFKAFDSLLDDLVEVEHVEHPGLTKRIPLIKILYKFFDKNQTQLANRELEARDPDGIFLNQIITFTDEEKFANIISELNNKNNELHRTFHLTYLKHDFNVFKNEEQINKEYENDLTVEYISYEADPTPKVGKNDADTPSISDNLYRLLTNKTIIDQLNSAFPGLLVSDIYGLLEGINNANKDITDAKHQLNCKNLYENLLKTDPNKAKNLSNYSNVNIQTVKAAIQKSQDLITELKFKINRALILYIISQCNVYTARVPYYLLNTFERKDFWENLKSGWGEALGIVVNTTLAGTSFGGPGGAVAGFTVGTGIASYQAFTKGVVTSQQLNIQEIRRAIKSAGLTLSSPTPGAQYLSGRAAAYAASGTNLSFGQALVIQSAGLQAPGQAAYQIAQRNVLSQTVTQDNIKDFREQILQNLALLEVQEEGPAATGQADIPFIFFGDLLKILTSIDSEILMFVGGKTILSDVLTGESSYINLCHIPIYLNSLTTFLKAKILDTEKNYHYSVDSFIRDLHEDLIKKSVKSADGVCLDAYKEYIPENLRLQTSVHIVGDDYNRLKDLSGKINTPNINDPVQVKNYKLNFIRSKNIQYKVRGNKKLAKIFTLASDQEIKYYNFYSNYTDWAKKNTLSGNRKEYTLYSGKDFQEYITSEHMIPCVLTRYTANDETILKKKNITFTRMDNPNMTVGNILDGKPIYRLPYNFKSDFQIFMSFFTDIGSLLYISPPDIKFEQNINTFGFGGLYLIAESVFEYSFQRLEKNNLTLPNEESTYRLGGYMISHGDGIKTNKNVQQDAISKCTDPIPVSNKPAGT